MKEWHRTIILVIFLVILIALIVVSRRLGDPTLGV